VNAPTTLSEDKLTRSDCGHKEDDQRMVTRSFVEYKSSSFVGHFALAVTIFFAVTAHVLLKFGVLQVQAHPEVLSTYFWILLGLGIYALGTCFWILCLSRLDLSYAYPFSGVTYVLVFIASWFLFGDSMSFQRVGGIVLICIGVVFVSRGGQS